MNGLFPRGCWARWIFLRSCGWRGVAFRLSWVPRYQDTVGVQGFWGFGFSKLLGIQGK